MTQDEIIEMARQAGVHTYPKWAHGVPISALKRFAALIAAAEREVCAKLCEDDCGNGALNLAEAIRARGQQ